MKDLLRRISTLTCCWLWFCLCSVPIGNALAQTTGPGQLPANDKSIQLDSNGLIELKLLVNYVAERTGTRFMFGQEVEGKKVRVIAPDPVPADSLVALLQSVLRNEGLVIADAGVEGWRRIVPLTSIPQFARPLTDPSQMENASLGEPLTRVFKLNNTPPTKVAELIRPLVSGGSIVPVDDQRLLIVSDVVSNMRRVEQLIDLLDVTKPLVNMKFVPVKHVAASELAKQLAQLLKSRAKALGIRPDGDKTSEMGSGIEVEVESRTNQLILIGNAAEIEQAEELLKLLDKELPTTQSAIQLQFTSPKRLDEVLRSVLEGRANRPPYQSRIEGNALIIESTQEVMQLALQVKSQIDTREAPDEQSPIRFYKIRNVPAQELLQTIQSIFTGSVQPQRKGLPDTRRTPRVVNPSAFGGFGYPGYGGPGYGGIGIGGANYGGPLAAPLAQFGVPPAASLGLNSRSTQAGESFDSPSDGLLSTGMPSGLSGSGNSLTNELIGEAQVTVDIHSNTIIVVAKPEVQRIYASLIEKLDKRRPQVLVEAKVVIVDTKDDFVFGVEYSGGDRTGSKKLFAFTSYGFSTVDPTNGALKILPGVGFNGTLVDPSTADVVVKALSSHKRARIISSPRILVNDNAEGELTSVLEVPFTSVNANPSVSTTTFGGFAEAGTTINVTPTISEDNHLQLDYVVTLNTFTGTGAAGIPPPRQTNEVRSRVTVPDGYTVIVGGLTSKNDSVEYRGLPWLEKVPILRELTGHTTNNWAQTSLFVFLRPVILRDDKFKDLKYLSQEELCDASVSGHYPPSATMSIP